MRKTASGGGEYALLAVLALLWGSSYLFIKIAVAEIPPITLMAARVVGAALFLAVVLQNRGDRLPRDPRVWALLGVQSFFNSIGAWTLLAWGQQFVDAGLAAVLNSTSPVFVVLISALCRRPSPSGHLAWMGVSLGIAGVVLIVGVDALDKLGSDIPAQMACLAAAVLYACAALFGRRFAALGAVPTATATMVWASVVLVPAAWVVDGPSLIVPSAAAIASCVALAIACTGVALLIYFRLIRTLGSLAVTSQSYLRAAVGVLLGMVLLGETLTLSMALGMLAALFGVALINWPGRHSS